MFVLEDCLAYFASYDIKILTDALDRRLLSRGISRVQWTALYYICREEGINQQRLSDLMGTRGPTIVRLLDRMQEVGLIRRSQSETNRRVNCLFPTEKGTQINRMATEVSEQFMRDTLSGISEEETALFRRILQTMVSNVTEA